MILKKEAGRSVLQRFGKSNRIAIYATVGVALSALAVCFLVITRYKAATRNMISVSDLEKSVSRVNGNVNMAYLFLSQEGIENYSLSETELLANLKKVEEINQKSYSRDLKDLTSTIRSYLSESDEIVPQINAYITIPGGESATHQKLSSAYDQLQQIYSYVTLRFQESYSGLLTALNEKEMRIQKQLLIAGIMMAGAYILTLILLQRYMSAAYRDFSYSITTLIQGIRGMQEDLMQAEKIDLHTRDEFEDLADAFNQMQSMLQAQQKKNAEIAEIKAQLAASENENLRIYGRLQKNHLDFLQSRINPHFLFNTLNMISAQAQIENAPKSAELMETTAAFLRYNLDNIRKTVTFDQELGNLRDYIDIQKFRYEERYTYEFHVRDNCSGHHMPCMVLQPLVENSLQHGLGMRLSGGKVTIIALRKNDRILFGVQDNGVGMTREKIENIYRNLRENTTTSSHLGLRNIYMRLKIFYHDDVTIDIKSNDCGMTILFNVPYTGGSI